MADHSPRVAPMRPNPAKLEARIHELAMESCNVAWGPHAFGRMGERDATDVMMFEVLRTGTLRGDITPGKNPGEWQCRLVKQMRGRRELGVATVIIRNEELFVKTVRWEDPR